MKILTIVSKLFLSLMLVFMMNQSSDATIYSINLTMTGSQEVPPVPTSATGTVTGTYNDVTNSLNFTITFSGLLGTSSAAHFHGPAAAGVNAGVRIGHGGFPTGVTSGTYSNTYVLTASNETELLSGLWYNNIHSSVAPGGEIRAQMILNPLFTLNYTGLIEGFYDAGANVMVRDTVTVNLRQSTSPYSMVDSKKAFLTTTGTGVYNFTGASNGTNYYLQVLHRNGLETWSNPASFTSNALGYDFTSAATQAFGNNLKLKGSKYCNYNGDVNNDGTIDGTDASNVDNAAAAFVIGYVKEDCDGNDFVDGTDGAIVDNNAAAFVTAIRP